MGADLVAMAPSGEALVVRDEAGRLWLIQPEGAGGRRSLTPDEALQVVAGAGFDRIDRRFDSWPELDAWRNQRAGAITPAVVVDRDALNRGDVERLLTVAKELASGGEGSRARRLAFELLRLPVVLGHPDLHDAMVSFAQSLDLTPVVPQARPAGNGLHAAARARWRTLTPAA